MDAVSLFSGAGGLDVGFEQAGYRILFANEIDADAAATWRANRPGRESVMHVGDVNEYLPSLGEYRGADVLFGGPPCQGFSVAGKMDPEDPRSKLVWSFLDAVEIVRPRAFVIENVRALGKLEKWSGVREGILKRAGDLGYDVYYHVYSAARFGVPQRRERVVFVGHRRDVPELKPFRRCMEERMCRPESLRAVLRRCGEYGSPENPQTCTAHVTLAKAPVMRRSPFAGMLVNGAGRPLDIDDTAHTLPASMGGNKTPIVDQDWLEGRTSECWFVKYHRGLVNGTVEPGEAHVPDTVRRLTVREAAAIQTFPKDYVFCGRKTKQYKQIGNAVAVRFAYAVADSLTESYGLDRA